MGKTTLISPAKLGQRLGVTKATVCNWLREGKAIAGVERVERMGNRWIITVAEICDKKQCG